jgi:lysyl-tRNA synthetase class 2
MAESILERLAGRNWVRMGQDHTLRGNLVLRADILKAVRAFFSKEDFLEIDPPALVPLPGMEPHLSPFQTAIVNQQGEVYPFHLHTSPEYALKKLLTAGLERIYAMGHVFRNGEISPTHNPEFMLLEWYRVGVDYRALMADCEHLFLFLVDRLGFSRKIDYQGVYIDLTPPWPRLRIGDVMRRHAQVDLEEITTLEDLVAAAHQKGYGDVSLEWPWEDVFYRIFLQEVEPQLPQGSPFFLIDYPTEMASLARPKPGAPRWVERFELYAGGLELANAFSELTDPHEQRRRLFAEQRQRADSGKDGYPVDATFLKALTRGLPRSAGIALGVDRLTMLLADTPRIQEVLPFPAEDLLRDWVDVWGEQGGIRNRRP